MPHVLVLFEYGQLNGAERSYLAMIPELMRLGVQISALAPAKSPLHDALCQLGVIVHPSSPVSGDQAAGAGIQLAEVARAVRPNVIHANSLSLGSKLADTIAACGCGSVVHLRDILKLSRAAVGRLNQFHRLIAVSHATKDYHVAQGIDGTRCSVIYNGVDAARFAPREKDGRLHRELNLDFGALLVGMIGQISSRKGQDILVRAAEKIASRHPLAHFVIIGTRHATKDESLRYEADLHAAIDRGGLTMRFHFLGRREDVADLLPEFTILAHPARQEPLGRVLLEGAATGCCIVASNVGGTREIFPDDSVACLIPADNPDLLAAALSELLSDEARRAEMGQGAREQICSQFSLPECARRLLETYLQVL